jgi:hypothetical protein
LDWQLAPQQGWPGPPHAEQRPAEHIPPFVPHAPPGATHRELDVPGDPTQHPLFLQVPVMPQHACPGSPQPAQMPLWQTESPLHVPVNELVPQQGDPRSPHLTHVPPLNMLLEEHFVPDAVHV